MYAGPSSLPPAFVVRLLTVDRQWRAVLFESHPLSFHYHLNTVENFVVDAPLTSWTSSNPLFTCLAEDRLSFPSLGRFPMGCTVLIFTQKCDNHVNQ